MSEVYEHVNHPTHYNHEGRKECWDEWVDKFGIECAIIICLGSADKYLYRAGTKKDNAGSQDVAKARAFVAKAESLLDVSLPPTAKVDNMYKIVKEELSKYDNNK